MESRSDRFIAMLDRVAEATGVPRLLDPQQTRPIRRTWVVPLLGLALAGWGLLAHLEGRSDGHLAVLAAWLMATLGQWFGPLRRLPADLMPDEFRADLFRRAHLAGLTVAFGLTIVGCGTMSFLSALHGPAGLPVGSLSWLMLAIGLAAVELNVATLVASWRLPQPLSDED
ncbi:hypothetical protein [Novosphingobium sp.]|uniref:hypothetical protein n=1 Tax=Novosphingobium sp. TaxID=1874826 RepID=UPI0026270CFC|nr:hypothetical protein [Novosphingobium sp.]